MLTKPVESHTFGVVYKKNECILELCSVAS